MELTDLLAGQRADTAGPLFSEACFLQLAPTVAYAITDRLALGVAPTLTMGKVCVDPLGFAPPTNGGYPPGKGTRYHWGGGAQAGIYYIGQCGWHWGLTIKSPQWFEDFRFHTVAADGLTPR